jgi:DNA polymerase-3 subunit epsilon
VSSALRDLDVLVIDCQAGGATPAHGDLLEIGWATANGAGLRAPIRQHFVIPRTDRRVSAAVRELTGWSEACIAESLPEHEVWAALRADIGEVAAHNRETGPVPAVIHYARFELSFLRDLHARLDTGGAFPLDVICLHAIAARLFADLPRRNIRALAGYLGHSTDRLRQAAGHVDASAFIWRALVPRLEELGVRTASDLASWLERPAPQRASGRRVFPFAGERRRALPEGPGVYRFLRSNRDVLYVGKAASIKKRVASHFSARASTRSTRAARGPAATTERVLELLTQVQEIEVTETASILEAALLESDEIKRLDPPYNTQLRSGERNAWFADIALLDATPAPTATYRIGPLPSQRALIGLRALIALTRGEPPDAALRACALSVPIVFLPDDALFAAGFESFAQAHQLAGSRAARARVERAARALWLSRGRAEPEAGEELAPGEWDLARVVRRLERSLTHGSLLVRRARWLGLLAHADVAFREPALHGARALVLAGAQIVERRDLGGVADLRAALPERRLPSRFERQACFDALAYDRIRVLATELNRIHEGGGEVAIRLGRRLIDGARLAQLMRWV